MVFGISSKSRYLCIDIQFDEIYFVVAQKEGEFFKINFTQKLSIEGGVFEDTRVRTPGKVADVLYEIQKKFGAMPVAMSIPECFCYATVLPGETYTSRADIRNAAQSLVSSPVYAWTSAFKKNKLSYTVLHTASKLACDTLYTLIKTAGFEMTSIYPRALVLAELEGAEDSIVCDIQANQTAIIGIYNSHATHFSIIPYGFAMLTAKIQQRFSLDDNEVREVCDAYGTDTLPRKEGHVVHGLVHTFLAPIRDEIHSIRVRQKEYGLVPSTHLSLLGQYAQYKGILEDLLRVTHVDTSAVDVWKGVIDLNHHIPSVHKNDAYQYGGIAGLMHIVKKGTRYEPFDL